MVVVLVTNHIEQVNIGRACYEHAVHLNVTCNEVVGHQHVGHTEVAMDVGVVGAVAIVIVGILGSARVDIVQAPGALVIGLDASGQEECRTQHGVLTTVETLDILAGVGESHVVLSRVAIDDACGKLNELDIERVVDTSGEAVVVRTSAFHSSLLLKVVERHIVGIALATTVERHVVVHTHTSLEDLVEPIGIHLANQIVGAVLNISRGNLIGHAAIGIELIDVLSILLGVHNIVHIVLNLVHAHIASVVNAHGGVLLTTLSCDDDDAVGSTRTVDSSSGGILENLNGLDVVWREVTNGGTKGHTVHNIERRSAIERAKTTDADSRVGTRLTISSNLHTRSLTLEHGGDVGV